MMRLSDLFSSHGNEKIKHTKGKTLNTVSASYDQCFQLTFLHDAPPPLGPVAQLQRVTLLYLRPLLEAADYLITQPVTIVYPLHRPFVVPRLQRNTTHNDRSLHITNMQI